MKFFKINSMKLTNGNQGVADIIFCMTFEGIEFSSSRNYSKGFPDLNSTVKFDINVENRLGLHFFSLRK